MDLPTLFYVIGLLCFGAAMLNAPSGTRFDYFSGGVFFAFLGWLIANGTIAVGS